MSDILRK